jgi:hypothetical protein
VWTVYGLHVTGCQLLCIARTLLVMWVVWCTRAYSVVEDVWSWTSWVGIGALVRAPAPIAHSLRHLFVHLLPGPCGHVALHIAVPYSYSISELLLGGPAGSGVASLQGWIPRSEAGRWGRLELVAAPLLLPPLRRWAGRAGQAAGRGRPGQAFTRRKCRRWSAWRCRLYRRVQTVTGVTGSRLDRYSRRRGNLGLLMCVRR